MREVEYLIIGQGIAGTVLGYQLLKKGKNVLIIDKGHEHSASYVAAGVVNPLVLKRLTLSWRALEFLDFAHSFYPELDEMLSIQSFHRAKLNKLISSEDEQLFWEKRWHSVPLDGIAERELEFLKDKNFKTDFKKGSVKGTAWVDLKKLLNTFREYARDKDILIEETFDYLDLECRNYRNIVFEKIIFCEGASCTSNPYFDFLPFSLNKGELITIKCPALNLKEIYKKKVFVLPLGNDLYRVGATYDRDFEKQYDAQLKRKELIEQFEAIFNCEYEIVNQESGIRPAVKDRRPLLGQHPLLKNFYSFNGLGSRGCLMAPKLSEELIDFMENGVDLNSEVDLNRFYQS